MGEGSGNERRRESAKERSHFECGMKETESAEEERRKDCDVREEAKEDRRKNASEDKKE